MFSCKYVSQPLWGWECGFIQVQWGVHNWKCCVFRGFRLEQKITNSKLFWKGLLVLDITVYLQLRKLLNNYLANLKCFFESPHICFPWVKDLCVSKHTWYIHRGCPGTPLLLPWKLTCTPILRQHLWLRKEMYLYY